MPKTTLTANQYRTHTVGELRKEHADQTVRLSGWVATRRDHGNLIFIDLRDRWGIVQLTFNPDKNKAAWEAAAKLKSEFVIHIEGVVRTRPPNLVNAKIATGEIEIEVTKLDVLSVAETPPFPIAADQQANEDIRLKYRFLDLRHPRLQGILQRRAALIDFLRQYMAKNNFVEVQTPILTSSSPEGARDFLVPSRLYPGKFYALPQAPQQFKQLLMVAGLDRYFQIAPCFRDEDPRADRHPGEFYQLDMEMSFVTQEDVFNMMEPLWKSVTKKFSNKKLLKTKFPRIPWKEAMNKYGSDKPDLRFNDFITDVTATVKKSGFKVFTDVVQNGGVVHALHVAGGAGFSRSDIDELTNKAKDNGAAGLAYLPAITKHLGEDVAVKITKKTKAQAEDAIFLAAGPWLTVCKALGAVRNLAAEKLNKKDPNVAAWAWIVDFPMYEYNEEAKKIDFSHNPFSMPQGGLEALTASDPTTILAYQYDTVLNGYEVSSGAIRNHDPAIMYKAFALAGYSKEEVDLRFGNMIKAFQFGAPPHGGNAPGIDRLMMVLWDLVNIRDIYAFPKNGHAQDVLMNAPSPVNDKQLKELHITIDTE